MSTAVSRERRSEIEDALKSGKAVIIHPAASRKFKGKVLTLDYPKSVR